MSKKKSSKQSAPVVSVANTAPPPNLVVNSAAKTHTDVVYEIQKIQAEQAKNNPQPEGVPFDFSKVHLHIGLPCYGGMLFESTMTSLIQFVLLAARHNLSWSLDTMSNESLISRGRNNLASKFLFNKAATHMMFIDSDIRFRAEDILRMIAADKDIIAGAYAKKSLPAQLNLNLNKETTIQGPLFTVDTAATGFLMFKRKVQEDLIAAHPNTKYVDDVGLGKQFEPFMYALFDCVIDEKGHYLSEDWTWCRRAAALGYKIWMDSRVLLGHSGTYEFKGDLNLFDHITSAAPAMPPTNP